MSPGPAKTGVALPFSGYPTDPIEREKYTSAGEDLDELHLLADDGRWYHMAPHIIERVKG